MPASTRARALILAFTFALLLALSLVPTVMTVSADSPDTVWAATGLGLYRSDDGGATWQFNPISADGFTPAAPRGEIPPTAVGGGPVAVDPRDPNKIYYFGGNGTVAGEGIFRSSDHGRTWSYKSLIDSTPAAQNGTDPRLPVTEENWFDKQCQLCLDYANPDNWYIGIWRSSDAGNTWQKMSIQNTRGVAPDPTVSGLVYAPQAPGLLVSHDYGATFTKLNVSGSAVGEYGVFVDPTTGDAYTSGGKTGVTKSSDGGTTWIDLPLQGGVPVSFDWANGDVYRGNYRSTDHGASWRIYTDPSTGLAGGFHNFLAIDPNASGHAFRWSVGDASASGGVSRTTDFGKTWTHVTFGPAICSQNMIQFGKNVCLYSTEIGAGDFAFPWPHINQRQPAPAQPATQPADIPAAQPTGLHFVQSPDNRFFFIQPSYGWMVVPDSISADDLGAVTIGDTWHHILNDQLQSIDSRIVQGADGQIYLIQGSQGWLLVPDSIAQPDLNALTIRGQIYGSVAAGWFVNPIVVALPPPPIAAAPGPAPSDSTPDTLTDDVRQSILDAITRANNGWVQAKATLITENLSGAVAGQELLDDTNEVIKLRNAHHLEKDTQQAFNVVDVTLDSPGHATVHTTETWLAEIDDPLGKLIQSVPPTSYNETYTVEFQDGAWIVTLDQLQPA